MNMKEPVQHYGDDHTVSCHGHTQMMQSMPSLLLVLVVLCLAGCNEFATPVHAEQPPAKPATKPKPPTIDPAMQWQLPDVGARAPTVDLLPGEDPNISRSIGDVSSGYLVNARALAFPHPHLAVLDVQSKRHLIYGTDQVIEIIEQAGAHVNRLYPGAITYLGNIGRKGGGDIRWSVSHNSGRDADLAFFVTDAYNNSAVMPDLLALDDDGRYEGEHGSFVFDTPRNWRLVEGLILAGGDSLQYIFVANWLRDMLLAHARSIGANSSVIARATALLQQPRATLPHNDHFHIRLFCAPTDVAVGCKNSGRYQSWRKSHTTQGQMAIAMAKKALVHPEAHVRLAGVRRLGLMGQKGAASLLIKRLKDTDPTVRTAASRVLASLGKGDRQIVLSLSSEKHPLVILEHLESLRRFKRPLATRALVATLKKTQQVHVPNTDLVIDTRLLSANALSKTQSTLPVATLIETLEDEDPILRNAAAMALRHLTNHQFYDRWAKTPRSRRGKKALRKGLDQWKTWYKKHKKMRRSQWVLLGFEQAGIKIKRMNKKAVWNLCRAIGPSDHLRYNAQLALMRLTGHNARSLDWEYPDANFYWRRWLERRQRKLRLSRIPRDLSTSDGYQKYLERQKQKKKRLKKKNPTSRRNKKSRVKRGRGKSTKRRGGRRN